MFEFSEIQPGDLIRVLVNFDDIEDDAFDMGYLGEDYYDGNYTGVDAPEYETYEHEE